MALNFSGLLPHQPAGVQFLSERPNAMLAWDPRCCKTSTAARAWECDPRSHQALVLCPATARENWARELVRYCLDPAYPPKVQVIRDSEADVDPHADIVVVNYDKLDHPKTLWRLRRTQWGLLICDEAKYLKSPDAKRTIATYGHTKRQPGVSLREKAERVWLLEGTPMPNHPAELWTHCYYLWPDAICYNGKPMELWEFELAYCRLMQTGYGMKVVGGKNLMELKERLSPYVHRLKYSDVFKNGLPRVDTWPLTTIGTRTVPDLPELVAKLAQRFGSLANVELFDGATLDAYLNCINAEFDAVASLRRETGTLKAVATSLLVREELQSGAGKTIVFAWHRDAIETLIKGLRAFNPAVLHGGVPAGARLAAVDKFNNEPTCRVFIGQIQAAGQIIDLSSAQNIVFAEHSWVPGENAQALLRASGPKQKAAVSVRFTYLPGSIDENVVRALARKTAAITQTFG